MSGKAPAFQFYPGDWRRDTQVQMASMETRGVWIEMLCCMWGAPERGKLEGTIEGLSRMLGCNTEILEKALKEIDFLKIGDVAFCDISGTCHAMSQNVTIINRRMYKEDKSREYARLRKQRQRAKCDSHAYVTPPSSSSSSSSSSISSNEDTKYLCSESGKNLPAEPEVIFIRLTLNDKSEYPITETVIASMSELYLAVDVRQEFRKMKGWLDADVKRRKTKFGIKKFYNGWLSRAQDKGGSSGMPLKEEPKKVLVDYKGRKVTLLERTELEREDRKNEQ